MIQKMLEGNVSIAREEKQGIHWTKEEVYLEPTLFFESLQDALAKARRSIDLECYIFAHDELGRKIVDSLMQARSRGVHVRVMVDGFGSPGWAKHFLPQLVDAGIQARIFHPMPWIAFHPGGLLRLIATVNKRNHRKVCIIDQHQAWLGGMNINQNHLQWRDTGVMVEGKGVVQLQRSFDQAWRKAWYPKFKQAKKQLWRRIKYKIRSHASFGRLVRLNNTRKIRAEAYDDLLKRISNATKRVWITNPYFIPTPRLLNALQSASKKGTEVFVLVPRYPDVPFIHWVSSALYYGLLTAGVRIFEYLPKPLHAKTLIIDSWVMVGSTNLNHRSLIHDLEVDVILEKEESIQTLMTSFLQDLKCSQEVTLREWKKRSILERFLGRILIYLKYWF